MKKFKFSIEGNKFEVSVNEIDNNVVEIDVNGSHYNVELDRDLPSRTAPVQRKTAGKVAPISVPAAANKVPSIIVKSQLPGSIIQILAPAGQSVKKGDVVLTIESMKMENNIMAEFDGVIKTIFVQATQSVMQDDKLFEIESSNAAPAPMAAAAPRPAAAPAPVAPAPAPATGGTTKPLRSPLPGSIIKIVVTQDQAVKRGETLLTMESMKMENEIKAEKDCIVRAIKISEGQSVMQDDILFDLE